MECPTCYDEESRGLLLNSVVKKSYLTMESIGYRKGYEYYQCPRCGRTRKQKSRVFSSGPFEEVSPEEKKEVSESSGSVLGTVATIGAGIILLAALFGESEE